eukprot:GEMP01070077.1.p1 GENE.GEMP01070077.1~~GEMP01070077.1.p1  ORF type:complete len:147 (-),score=19.55 GEMP01070077.1:465-905(-)
MVNPKTHDNFFDPRCDGTIPYGLAYLVSCAIAGSEVYIIGRYLATQQKPANNFAGPSTTPLYQGSSYTQQPSSATSYCQQPYSAASWNYPVINRMTMYDSRRCQMYQQPQLRRLPPLNVYSEEFSEVNPSEYNVPPYYPECPSQHW